MRNLVWAVSLISVTVAVIGSASAAPCANPVDFGAIPNDGISDRVALQAALDSVANGGELCVPDGVFSLDRAPVGSYNRYAALSTHGHDILIQGAPGATLELIGDQGAQGTLMLSLDASARNITVRGIFFDGHKATNTDEQTHLTALSGICSNALGTCNPIENIVFENNVFFHPRSTVIAWRRGDSIRLLGNEMATRAYRITVRNNTFLDSGRSAVELQRGLNDVLIENNYINCVSCDQAIDGEASGVSTVDPGMEDYDVRILNNIVVNGPGAQGDYDLVVTSAVRAEIAYNQIVRGIAAVRSRFVKIHHQDLLVTMKKAEGVIESKGTCEDLEIDNVTIVRSGVAGPLVRVVPSNNGRCTAFSVKNSFLIQRTASFGIWSQAANAVIWNNRFSWNNVAQGPAAVYGEANVAPITSFLVTDNIVVGTLQAVIGLQVKPMAVSGVIHSNKAVGTTAMCLGNGCP